MIARLTTHKRLSGGLNFNLRGDRRGAATKEVAGAIFGKASTRKVIRIRWGGIRRRGFLGQCQCHQAKQWCRNQPLLMQKSGILEFLKDGKFKVRIHIE